MSKVITEENVSIKSYGEKITKELEVFYNPVMKINRDMSLLFIKSYFSTFNKKKIKFCDPMVASGIRELRFLKSIPEIFEKVTMGDVSNVAIENVKRNFEDNGVSMDLLELERGDAINTISKQFYDFIEIDPFGSPVPFIDIALQRVKHNGILSVTATDTAALCGTYPKRTLRRYGMSVKKTLCYEEVGLRNLIAHCQIQAAKFDKVIVPMVSFSYEHFYKIFFRVCDSKSLATQAISDLRFVKWDRVSQAFEFSPFCSDLEWFGKLYVGSLCEKKVLEGMVENIDLITDQKKISKLLDSLVNEVDVFGYFNVHKLEKEFGFSTYMKFDELVYRLCEEGFIASRTHGNRLGIKTNAKASDVVKILNEKLN